MISVAEAQNLIRAALPPPSTEILNVPDLAGRVLAQDIIAPRPQPIFTNSAMDGYAVRAADVQGASREQPATLNNIGVVAAGTEANRTVTTGTCVQIMTGAPVPAGADAVVKVEDTSGYDDRSVEVYLSPRIGENLRQAGEEFAAGQKLISSGARIDPGVLGVIASCGLDGIEVYKRPTVALYATGDELREPGEPLLPGQIYNSNLPVLGRLAQLAGAEVVVAKLIRDNKDDLRSFLTAAVDTCQVVVASGGVSMGKFDFVRDVLLELGIEERFWKVAQMPGKPLFFGTHKQALLFGLPGNPVSALAVFMEYVWPTLERLHGLHPEAKLTVILDQPFPAHPVKHRFLFGRVWAAGGRLLAAPTRKLGSHMFTATLGANAILEAPPGKQPLPAKTPVLARLLPWGVLDEVPAGS